MEDQHADRRKAVRYPIEAKVIVQKNSGETIPAIAANISSGGMLLDVAQPSLFSVDEEVTVDVELPDNPSQPFSAWGVARVLHIDCRRFGIQLRGGTFDIRT